MAVQINTINIGMTDTQRDGVVTILRHVLADQHLLYIKTRNYHWNVVGPLFHTLHELFESQYIQLATDIDNTAERIRYLGAPAIGTLTEFQRYTTLTESPEDYPDAITMITNLVMDHETMIRNLRSYQAACDEEYQDMGTNDFLIGLMQQHEAMAWMLRAFLQERP